MTNPSPPATLTAGDTAAASTHTSATGVKVSIGKPNTSTDCVMLFVQLFPSVKA